MQGFRIERLSGCFGKLRGGGGGGGGKLYMSELEPSLGNTFLADRTDVGAYRRGLNDSRVLGPAIL